MRKNVTEMTKHELYIVISTETEDLKFVEACIKENNKRRGNFVKKCLAEGKNAGGEGA